ncbi:DUF4173 domain-containing protein [Paenibacillus filicis]|uniref:DUF4173 domain-containing protein n=1 Tax=Paenibacillus filicis TaxID=669464 RepID=A0ABU9DGW0_9BACL
MTLPLASSYSERKLLVGSLICGLLHYLFFFDKEWGVSIPLFVLAFYLLLHGMTGLGIQGLRAEPASIWLLPIALLSLTYALYTNSVFTVLNALAIPLLIVLHTTAAYRKDKRSGIVGAMLEQAIAQTLMYVPRPITLAAGWVSAGLGKGSARTVGKVVLGLLLAAPILAAVIGLLASADAMFNRSLARLPEMMNDLNMGEAVIRILWVVFIMTGIFAYIAGLLNPKQWQVSYTDRYEGGQGRAGGAAYPPGSAQAVRHRRSGRPGLQEAPSDTLPEESREQPGIPAWDPGMPQADVRPPGTSGKLDATVAATVLILLNAVYLLFAFVQFSYFFGGGTAELPDGVTYASYARRGFAELVTATVINLTLLVGALYGVKRPSAAAWLGLRALLALLVGCTGIMLSSAYIRLSMYEEAYGYTVTRLLVHAFMIFLLVLFVLALVKLWKEQLPLARSYAAAAVIAYVLINYIGIDAMIVRNNAARYERTGELDAGYLASLGYGAVPSILALKKSNPELAEEALQRHREMLGQQSSPSWTEFNWSKWRARQALKADAPVS